MAWKSSGYGSSIRAYTPPPTSTRISREQPRKTERASFCVGCGAGLKPDYSVCPKCGVKIGTVSTDPSPTFRCNHCRKEVLPEFAHCPYCSLKIIGGIPEPIGPVCVQCGAARDVADAYCGGCGTPATRKRARRRTRSQT